jgi:hypothetical protein
VHQQTTALTFLYETLPTIAMKTRQLKAAEHNTRCLLNLNKLLRVTFPLVPHPNTTLFTMLLYVLFSRGTNGKHLGMERRRAKGNNNIMTAVRDLKKKCKMKNEEKYTIKTSIICNL